jgi:hypothetical protein
MAWGCGFSWGRDSPHGARPWGSFVRLGDAAHVLYLNIVMMDMVRTGWRLALDDIAGEFKRGRHSVHSNVVSRLRYIHGEITIPFRPER